MEGYDLIKKYEMNEEIEGKLETVRDALSFLANKISERKEIARTMALFLLSEAKQSYELEGVSASYEDIFRSVLEMTEEEEIGCGNEARVARYVQLVSAYSHRKDLFDDFSSHEYITISGKLKRNITNFSDFSEYMEDLAPEPDHMIWWNRCAFILNDFDEIDPLISLAFHYFQMEDGRKWDNDYPLAGRAMALLILYLKEQYIILPFLPISTYFAETKDRYDQLIREVKEEKDGAVEEWIDYILLGVQNSAVYGVFQMEKVIALFEYLTSQIEVSCPQWDAEALAWAIIDFPMHSVQSFAEVFGADDEEAKVYLEELAEKDLLEKKQHGEKEYYSNQLALDLLADMEKMEKSCMIGFEV